MAHRMRTTAPDWIVGLLTRYGFVGMAPAVNVPRDEVAKCECPTTIRTSPIRIRIYINL
jgi:hypothetical protein